MTDPQTIRILAPDTGVSTLRTIMENAGFTQSAAFNAADDTHPDRIIWDAPQGRVTLITDLVSRNMFLIADPKVGLPSALQYATASDARTLMGRDSIPDILAGLQIAKTLGDATLVPWIIPKLQSRDTVIATAATEAFTVIAGDAIQDIDPGVALFSVPGWRQEKLQLLRWMAFDPTDAVDMVAPLLAKAICHDDWEIAVTAMLTAARLNCADLIPEIRRTTLPQNSQDGLTRDEMRFVLALRDGALEHLGAGNNPRLPDGILAAVSGDPSRLPARFAAVFHALSQPLPDHAPEPDAHPDIVRAQTGPTLVDGTLLVWVPPIPHWVGDDAINGPIANPLRRITPEKGFFINAEPLGPMSYQAALALVEKLNSNLGLAVSLATSDAWEMAARGPDGRRFLWGMNGRCKSRTDLSPWGMSRLLNSKGEWLFSEPVSDTALSSTGRKSPILATRKGIHSLTELCVRVVFTL